MSISVVVALFILLVWHFDSYFSFSQMSFLCICEIKKTSTLLTLVYMYNVLRWVGVVLCSLGKERHKNQVAVGLLFSWILLIFNDFWANNLHRQALSVLKGGIQSTSCFHIYAISHIPHSILFLLNAKNKVQ